MEQYKEEIIRSRKGALGGSDADMLKQIADLGYVPESAKKRLAVLKGFIEQPNITTAAMRYGDFIEQSVFESLQQTAEGQYVSNPCLISKKYSKPNVTLLCHPDFMFVDDDRKIVYIYECKATRYSVIATKETYRPQMYVEWMLARELYPDYSIRLSLVHYDALGVDLDEEFTFNPEKMTITRVFWDKNALVFDIDKAMSIVNGFLETFDAYYEEDEIDADYLPETIKDEFAAITVMLEEISSREAKIDEFRKRLYDFMLQKNIKSIRNDKWSMTRVDATESVTFDHKAFLSEYATKHPILYKKLIKTYEKRTKRKGSVQIRVNKKEEKN